jgi:hypothetical protein
MPQRPAAVIVTRVTRSLLVCSALTLGASSANAQGVCRPPTSSNEADLLAFFATPIAFSPGGMVAPLAAWRIRIGAEVTYVPSPSKEMQQPEACYGIKKTENTNLSPVFPRPRVSVGLPGGLLLEGSYLPPVNVADAEPNLGSVALSRPFRLAGSAEQGGFSLLFRGHATFGRVRGSITCPEKNLQQQDPNAACYGTDASSDTYKPNMFGAEVGAETDGAGERWGTYVSAGVTWLRPRFQVGFQYLGAGFDDTKITVDMTRFAVGAGGWYHVSGGAALTAELYSVPADATTLRLGGVYTFW